MVQSNKIFPSSIYSMKTIQHNPHIIESLSCIPNIFCVIDLPLILFKNNINNNNRNIFNSKESKYTAVFLSIDNETH